MRSFYFSHALGRLHVAEYGDPKGRPLFFFHGFPGSHAQALFLDEAARALGIRVLAPDRPGYGFSKFPAKTKFPAFLAALKAFIEAEDFRDILFVGVSGGNPSAIAMASLLPERTALLGSISGLVPFTVARDTYYPGMAKALALTQYMPKSALALLLRSLMRIFPGKIKRERMLERLGKRDREVLAQPKFWQMLESSMALARLQGPKGVLFDLDCYVSPWQKYFVGIESPYFAVHGDEDSILPHRMTERLQSLAPKAQIKIFPGEGHYSLPIFHVESLLRDFLRIAGN